MAQNRYGIIERYCPYVNRNVALQRGPRCICTEAKHCPMQERSLCKHQSKEIPPKQ